MQEEHNVEFGAEQKAISKQVHEQGLCKVCFEIFSRNKNPMLRPLQDENGLSKDEHREMEESVFVLNMQLNKLREEKTIELEELRSRLKENEERMQEMRITMQTLIHENDRLKSENIRLKNENDNLVDQVNQGTVQTSPETVIYEGPSPGGLLRVKRLQIRSIIRNIKKKQRKINNLREYQHTEIKGKVDDTQREMIYGDVDSMHESSEPKKKPILYPHHGAVAFYLNDEDNEKMNFLYHHQKRE
ncbi:hypothetical protein Acr_24g0008740 [Actinidia rufa]|uniref:Uncharacterized protein n=1 Tax=Actinidia rufa TaxID=165716 RepID=A0A7J0GVZ3_9ERIC|nr:hypothetical protein Acr_24g0008740 [Actinidia rufa]